MVDDGILSLLLELSILVAAALWGIIFAISKDFREMINLLEKKI